MALAPTQSLVETPSRLFYRDAMEVLNRAKVPFLVGGAYAQIFLVCRRRPRSGRRNDREKAML